MEISSNSRAVPSLYWLEGFARQATDTSQSEENDEYVAWYTELLKSYVPQRAELALDVGCGTGRVIRAIAALAPDCQCVGIDGNEGTLEVARRELATHRVGATLHKIDITEHGFSQLLKDRYGRFAVITSLFVLHHYSPAKAAEILRELRILLAPGGLIVLAEVHDPNCQKAAIAEQVCADLSAMAGQTPDLLWTKSELLEACRLAGFGQTDLRLEPAPGSPFKSREDSANCASLDQLWARILAAENTLALQAEALRLEQLKRVVTRMREHGIARPSRFGPLLAILQSTTTA